MSDSERFPFGQIFDVVNETQTRFRQENNADRLITAQYNEIVDHFLDRSREDRRYLFDRLVAGLAVRFMSPDFISVQQLIDGILRTELAQLKIDDSHPGIGDS